MTTRSRLGSGAPRGIVWAMRLVVHVLSAVLLALVLVSCGSDPSGEASTDTGVVPVSQVAEALDQNATVVDVRTPQEYAQGHLPAAVNIDVTASDFEDNIAALDKSATYVVYCRSGSRSTTAAQIMAENGFDDVINAGGYDDLVSAGLG